MEEHLSVVLVFLAALVVISGLIIVLRNLLCRPTALDHKRGLVGAAVIALGLVGVLGGHFAFHVGEFSGEMQTTSAYEQLLTLQRDASKSIEPDVLATTYKKGVGLWWKLLIYRVEIRSALRDLCTCHGVTVSGDTAFTTLAGLARDHKLIDKVEGENHYQTLIKFASDTHFVEWNDTPVPPEKRLKEIQSEAPRELDYLQSLGRR